MSTEIDWIERAGARAKGRRPAFHDDLATARLTSILLSVVADLSATRERVDTLERLLDARGVVERHEVETYEPDAQAAYERGVATKAFIARVMRGVQQEMEAMMTFDAPIDDICHALSRD